MLANGILNLSMTATSTSTNVSENKYAPIFKIKKSNYQTIGKNGEYIIDIYELGDTTCLKSSYFISVWQSGTVNKLNFVELINPEIECFVVENSNDFTLYARPSTYGTSIISQVVFSRHLGYIEGIMGEFDTLKTSVSPIYATKILDRKFETKRISENTYKTDYTTDTSKYLKIASMYIPHNYQGHTISIDIEERQNQGLMNICGRIYIKTRKNNSNGAFATIRSGSLTTDFIQSNINVIGIRKSIDLNTIDVYIKTESSNISFNIKPNIYEINAGSYNNITLYNQEAPIEMLPTGTLYPLFAATEDYPIDQEEEATEPTE